MKTRVQLALVGCLISVLAHLYLAIHYYPLNLGLSSGQSICNINAKLDCDAVSASAYSAFLGIPVALWGAMLNAVLFVLILLAWLEWSEYPERLKRWSLGLAFASCVGTVVMGLISVTLMEAYCIVCISLYALSFLVFWAYRGTLREPFWMHFKRDIPKLWPESKGILVGLAMIPAGAYLGDQFFMSNFGSERLAQMVSESVADWQHAPVQQFVAKPSLVTGPESDKAALTITEFADFMCGHCKHASYSLDAFVRAHPDVRFEFYAFPLDGACNEKIESSSGIPCKLATLVVCAERENKGWDMHHLLFEEQSNIIHAGSPGAVDELLAHLVPKAGLNWQMMQTCLADPAAQDAVKAQAKQGGLVNVGGTPTIFANGRVLSAGQRIAVLQAAREKALAEKAAAK